ncbi:OsmC family protein [Alteromonas lipotrueiana]|uniref:OsmC family protein n=1 Tax=Alteromonas lipotrueiana TaxID=2803815 RepID=UPI001C4370E9|nr:OsmC family protein [Alteromonas lipotrueiana]|tara:strand:+ start:202 stop:606 length:405 start_codon:yes stop_codon:yes gene_type:complete
MKATVSWNQDLSFTGVTESGYKTVMDGNGKAISPMESVLLAVGACSSIDVVDILKKGRNDVTHCECELDAQRAEEPPKVFTSIHAHYVVTGQDLSEKAVSRAVKLSAEKYCSVMLMVKDTVTITTSFTLNTAQQ